MRVARDTGRSVLTVAHESFALTLYTLYHLQQLARAEQHDRQIERFDMAGLFTQAMWKPERLDQLKDDYVARIKGDDPQRVVREKAARDRRTQELLAAHQRMTLVRTDAPR